MYDPFHWLQCSGWYEHLLSSWRAIASKVFSDYRLCGFEMKYVYLFSFNSITSTPSMLCKWGPDHQSCSESWGLSFPSCSVKLISSPQPCETRILLQKHNLDAQNSFCCILHIKSLLITFPLSTTEAWGKISFDRVDIFIAKNNLGISSVNNFNKTQTLLFLDAFISGLMLSLHFH